MARLCTPNVSVDYDDSIDADQSFDTAFPSAATSMSWANTWPELQARADGAQQARRRSSRPSILLPHRRRCSPVRPRFTHTHTHTHTHTRAHNRCWTFTATLSSASTAASTRAPRSVHCAPLSPGALHTHRALALTPATLPQLRVLDVSNNDLDSLGDELACLPRLHTLRLSFNHIQSVAVFAEPLVAQGTHTLTALPFPWL